MWRTNPLRIFAFFLLACGAMAQSARPKPQATFRISGIAVDASSDQPLAGVEVVTGPAEGSEPPVSVTTEDDGRFEFAVLKSGKYWLMAERNGYMQQNFNQHEEFSTAIAVGPKLTSENLIFRLRPDASISGTITDEAGEPIRAAQVLLYHDAVEGGKRTIHQRAASSTDDLGHYHFGHVIPGRFFLAVSAKPWYARPRQLIQETGNSAQAVQQQSGPVASSAQEAPSPLDVAYPLTFYPGVTDENAAAPLELKPGDRASADITMTAVPSAHLVIKDAAPEAEPGVSALLVQRIFDGPAITVANESARAGNDIEISGAPQGQVELRLQSFSQKPSTLSRRVNLTADGEISKDQFSASSDLTGVLTVDGAPPSGGVAFIQLWDRNSATALGTQAGSKGEFSFESSTVQPGNYEVRVFNLPKTAVRSVSADGAAASGRTVRISGGSAVKLKVEATHNLCRVDGTVLQNGKPLAGAMVVLVPHDPTDSSLYRRDQSDSDGTFSLRDALPGTYSVIALTDWDAEWLNPSVLKPYLKHAEAVEAAVGKSPHVEVKVQ